MRQMPKSQNSQWTGRADLHVHTNFSDGSDSPGEVVEFILEHAHLDVIAITDHDTIDGALLAAEHVAAGGSLHVVIGEEVSSSDGHILGLFLSELIDPHMPAAETVAAIHAQGGVAIAAHPFWRSRRIPGRIPSGVGRALLEEVPFDAVETTNGGFTPSMWSANRTAAREASTMGLVSVGGSDAHIMQAVGWSHTIFDGLTAEDLARSLRTGNVLPATRLPDPYALFRYARWASGPTRSKHPTPSPAVSP
jgi:predicted metal-dependent phosphoesterase TrpH